MTLQRRLKTLVLALALFTPLVTLSTVLCTATAAGEEIMLDTVLASVDNEPVTLLDVSKVVGKELTLEEFQSDEKYKQTLQALVNRKMLEKEAKDARISVSPEELDAQIQQIAAQNQLSMEQFKEALKAQNQDLEMLKSELRFQILRSKVVRSNVRSGGAISDEAVLEHLGVSTEKERVDLSYLAIRFDPEKDDREKIKAFALKVFKWLQSGVPFNDVRSAHKDKDIAIEEHKIVAKEELSPMLVSALEQLDEGEFGRPILLENAIQFIKLNGNLKAGEPIPQEVMEKTRIQLQSAGMQDKALNFLKDELPKRHHVEFIG